jgi:hypothetical protein
MRWCTRAVCHIDRSASAWLIRRSVDPDAEGLDITAPVFDGLYEYRRRAVLTGRDPS